MSLTASARSVPSVTTWTVSSAHPRRSEFCARAGHAVAVFVDDLYERVGGIGARGIVPASREAYGNGVRLVVYRDPDGNEIGFGGARSSGWLIPAIAAPEAVGGGAPFVRRLPSTSETRERMESAS